jgi:hypothetical protein
VTIARQSKVHDHAVVEVINISFITA